jgi:deoxycytidylate deaminase
MDDTSTSSPELELVFGLVAPIGVDLNLVSEVLAQTLAEMEYEVCHLRLTTLMRDLGLDMPLTPSPYIQSFKDRIAYANQVRSSLGDSALAALAIQAIRGHRTVEWGKKLTPDKLVGVRPDEVPLPRQAYIIRQFKRPEEITLLRGVYGKQFILLSAYVPPELRRRRIGDLERQSRGGLISEADAYKLAYELVVQDSNEAQELHGQNVRDAFPLGDVFIDATSRQDCETTIRRFIRLLFGDNEITPTRDEYGMYMAKSASLRSSDLSRQVGAAIFRPAGEVITLGCNEVPKAGGGTYWFGDPGDKRDFVVGYDPNDRHRFEVLVDVLYHLKEGKHLSKQLMRMKDVEEIAKALLAHGAEGDLSGSKVMDLLEFGRIIHAEMSAICDAARKGTSVEGATLYCTTFPCHMCAKHIVASGIRRMVYIEPYPKSYASNLHSDAIEVESASNPSRVQFEAFIGVSPYRYRDLFEKGRRKYRGVAQKWHQGERRPMIEISFPSYFVAEAQAVASVKRKLDAISSQQKTVTETKQID